MTYTDFHKAISIALLVWAAIALALTLSPSRVINLLTYGRIKISKRTALIARILGIVNAFGAVHIYWFGR